MNRRAFLATTAAAAAAATMKAASAATVTPFGQTGAPTLQTDRCPWDRYPGARYPDSRLESMKKPKRFVRAYRFPGLRRHHGG